MERPYFGEADLIEPPKTKFPHTIIDNLPDGKVNVRVWDGENYVFDKTFKDQKECDEFFGSENAAQD